MNPSTQPSEQPSTNPSFLRANLPFSLLLYQHFNPVIIQRLSLLVSLPISPAQDHPKFHLCNLVVNHPFGLLVSLLPCPLFNQQFNLFVSHLISRLLYLPASPQCSLVPCLPINLAVFHLANQLLNQPGDLRNDLLFVLPHNLLVVLLPNHLEYLRDNPFLCQRCNLVVTHQCNPLDNLVPDLACNLLLIHHLNQVCVPLRNLLSTLRPNLVEYLVFNLLVNLLVCPPSVHHRSPVIDLRINLHVSPHILLLDNHLLVLL